MIGISRQWYCKFENNRLPLPEIAVSISNAFQLNIAERNILRGMIVTPLVQAIHEGYAILNEIPKELASKSNNALE